MNVVWAAIICIALFLIIYYLCWGSAKRHSSSRSKREATDSASHTTGQAQAFMAETTTPEYQQATSQPPEPDDLTRIKGIGKVIEKKLHNLQITSFEQIANFTPADIERVNQVLDFVGRIEREKWVEQARELSRS